MYQAYATKDTTRIMCFTIEYPTIILKTIRCVKFLVEWMKSIMFWKFEMLIPENL